MVSAPSAQRYALANGVARLLYDPTDMIAGIENAADDHCRKNLKLDYSTVGRLTTGPAEKRPSLKKIGN